MLLVSVVKVALWTCLTAGTWLDLVCYCNNCSVVVAVVVAIVMVGKITVAPVALCVDRIKILITGGANVKLTTKLYKFRQGFHKNTTLWLFSALLFFLLFVLYVTNQKPAYTHTNVIYDEHSIHDNPDSDLSYGVSLN